MIFPAKSPKIIPKETGSTRLSLSAVKFKLTPAFASAKRGMTIRPMGRCSVCSSLAAGELTALICLLCFVKSLFVFHALYGRWQPDSCHTLLAGFLYVR